MASMTGSPRRRRPTPWPTCTRLPGIIGRRRELIDGMLFVSPAPGWPHQEMALTLYTLLRAACPPELHVLAAPFAVTTSAVDEVQPAVLVRPSGAAARA